jgi:hypothetical protein
MTCSAPPQQADLPPADHDIDARQMRGRATLARRAVVRAR